MTDLEYRDVRGLEVRSEGEKAQLVGYASVFHSETNLGFFREQVAPGAFARSLRESPDVRALVDHDTGRVVGRTKSGTLRLVEDQHGLRAEIDVADTSSGRDILELVKRGDVDGMSFGFRPVDERWEKRDGGDLRTLLDVELLEVSVVAFPAYSSTSISARSAARAFEERRRWLGEVELLRAKVGTYKARL